MDLIYMNANREDVGVLQNYDLDLAFGADENSFECKIQAPDHCCEPGWFLYIDGTEYGGIIDSIQIDTANNEVTYYGRTWHGILGSKVIVPFHSPEHWVEGLDWLGNNTIGGGYADDRYLAIGGNANSCIQFIINRVGLKNLFAASTDEVESKVEQYKFDRYTDAYVGLRKMLKSAGLKMKVKFDGGMVVLSAVDLHDYSQDEEFDSDSVEFTMRKNYNSVNHLICLGTGELENRMVIHLYADENGNVSQTQSLFNEDEYVAVFDYPNAESEEELIKSGTDELKALWEQNKLTVDFDPDTDVYGVGDIVGAYDNHTKTSVSAEVIKKIVTIKNGQINISYEVGEK